MTTPATKFYAVADINGPITVRINAETAAAAREWFDSQTDNFGDDCRTDAEDDLDVCGDGMSASEWSDVMERTKSAVPAVLDIFEARLTWF